MGWMSTRYDFALIFILCAALIGCDSHKASESHVPPELHSQDLTTPQLTSALQTGNVFGIAIDGSGNVFIADTNDCTVWEFQPDGVAVAIAGVPRSRPEQLCQAGGDSGPATDAELQGPLGVAVDARHNLFIADPFAGQVREVSGGIITTVAQCSQCSNDIHAPPLDENPQEPSAVAVTSTGDLLIADGCRILKRSDGRLSVIAGTGACSPTVAPLGGPPPPALPALTVAASAAHFGRIGAIAVGPRDEILAADPDSCMVWKIVDGFASVLAGSSRINGRGDCVSDGVGTGLAVHEGIRPTGLAVDVHSTTFVSDSEHCKIAAVTSDGEIATVEDGVCGSLAVDSTGRLYVLDFSSKRLLRLTP
jgi:hypothetical protein